MWLLFAALSFVATGISFYRCSKGKNYKPFMALALSFTALTDCAEYSMVSVWAKAGDSAALFDVAPSTSTMLWIFTVIMIVLNILPAFLDKSKS